MRPVAKAAGLFVFWPMAFSAAMPRQAQPSIVRWVKRASIAVAAAYTLVFCWSVYRRLWQINRIELNTSSAVLSPGATITYDVVTSGEVQNRIRLELVQGTHAETLREEVSRVSAISALDLRLFRYERLVTVTPETLSRFRPGPATVRLTGFGSQKLLRTPAPRVRELVVQIR
jgi:hypothetical protein